MFIASVLFLVSSLEAFASGASVGLILNELFITTVIAIEIAVLCDDFVNDRRHDFLTALPWRRLE